MGFIKSMFTLTAVGILMAVLSGCATKGEVFRSDTSWIAKDKTKKTDVKGVLGEPYQVGYASGLPTWTYGYYKYRLFGATHTKELKIYWNRDGTVHNFAFTSSFPEDIQKGTSEAPALKEK